MNQFKCKHPAGATPLNPDEIESLIPKYIDTQELLAIEEQKNIEKAIVWLEKLKKTDVLNIEFTYKLHKQMFGQVWEWAGQPRKTDKNIGVNWETITVQLNELFENTKYWIKHNTYKWDECAARFHHKLVFIHVFSNGNGRHARLMTDLLLKENNQQEFSWGEKNGQSSFGKIGNKNRERYIASLKKADDNKNSFDDLIRFARN